MAFAARLDQTPIDRLFDNANTLTRPLSGLRQLFGLDALVVRPPAGRVKEDSVVAAVSDAVERLRVLTREQLAIVLALPGPATIADDGDMEEGVDQLLDLTRRLHPEQIDAVALVEERALGDARSGFPEVLAPLWNTASYYGLGRIFVTCEAGAFDSGADAIVTWSDLPKAKPTKPQARVGIVLRQGQPLPHLAEGEFYTTEELLPDTDIEWFKLVVSRAARCEVGTPSA